MCETPEKDLYAVLGASSSDSAQQLKHKYQQLALQVNTILSASVSVWSNMQPLLYENVHLSALLFH